MFFNELGLSAETLAAIEAVGYSEATPIQSQAIPLILAGHDLTGQAQTGTGKTAAFGIPAIEKIDPNKKGVQCLILCPTRELALQVSVELKKFCAHKKGIFISTIYGGDSMDRQIKDLKRGVQIVVGTPGRVIDHLDRKTLNASTISQIILDEADEMLNMGFREDIELVLERLPETRQIIMFSATMPAPILSITKRFQKNPQFVRIERKEITVDTIEQFYYLVKEPMKMEIMTQLIDLNNLQLMLVFCNTKKKVDEVTEELRAYGYRAVGLHGDKSQRDRNDVMTKFRKGMANILVATDVAARGIDVSGVDSVINFDVPLDIENYVHRIGRTGRAGQLGKSFTLVTGGDKGKLREIEMYTKAEIKRTPTPTKDELIAYKKSKVAQRIKLSVESGDTKPWEDMLNEFLASDMTKEEILVGLSMIAFPDLKDLLLKEDIKPRERNERGEGRGDRYDRGDRRGSDRGDRRGGDRDRGPRGDYGDRSERSPRRESGRRFSNENMTRLFFNVGKKDRINPGDIVGAISGEANIKGSSIGQIDIFDKYSFVEVQKEVVEQVMSGMRNNTIKGKSVNIEVAN
jgi:ATP-dependent RNA helicase DeaD